MCYWIMGKNGIPITETTVQHVTRYDMLQPTIAKMTESFHEALETRLDSSNFTIQGMEGYSIKDECDLPQWDRAYGDNDPTNEEYQDMSPFEPLADAEDEIDPEVYDKYIGAKIVLDDTVDGGGNVATVKSRITNINGHRVGITNNNPLLDSREYDAEMEDEMTNRLFANKIAENIYSQLDDKGR